MSSISVAQGHRTNGNSYSFVKGYLESFKEHYNLSQKEVEDEIMEAPKYETEAELFS